MSINIKNPQYFWISNISDMDVHVADLCIDIKAGKTINLLDKKHHNLSYEKIKLSESSGSLFKKQSKVKVRKVPPYIEAKKDILEIDYNANVPSRRRSVVEVKEIYYEELDISDDEFAAQSIEIDNPFAQK